MNIIKNHKNSIYDSQRYSASLFLAGFFTIQLLFTITLRQAEAERAAILLIVTCHVVALTTSSHLRLTFS